MQQEGLLPSRSVFHFILKEELGAKETKPCRKQMKSGYLHTQLVRNPGLQSLTCCASNTFSEKGKACSLQKKHYPGVLLAVL